MAKISSIFLILIPLIWSVKCNNYTKFPSEYDPIKLDLISKKKLNISNIVSDVLFGDWTDNVLCLVELNAIKYGLRRFEEWAIKSELYWFYFLEDKILFELITFYFYSC